MIKETFKNIIDNYDKSNINYNKNKCINELSDNIYNLPNLILYGPNGIGKYNESLNIIKKFSKHNLEYEKKIIINSNKSEHIIKISDIHYEINLENLTCNPKIIFNDIYNNIVDIIETTENKVGIILLKNFHSINNELLQIIYSYFQYNILNNIHIVYIILTSEISFIPINILNICKTIYLNKLSKSNYIKLSNNNKILKNHFNNNDIIKNNINNIKLIKYSNFNIDFNDTNINNKDLNNIDFNNTDLNSADITNNLHILDINKSICDNLLNIIFHSKNNIYYNKIRNILYDILIYNLNIYECINYILINYITNINNKINNNNHINNNKNNNNNDIKNIMNILFIKTGECLKYYNNNYRPIYHIESYIIFLINLYNKINLK